MSAEQRIDLGWTSAQGFAVPMPNSERPLVGITLVLALGLAGTSSSVGIAPEVVLRSAQVIEQTSTRIALTEQAPSGAAIGEVRRLTGLTWEQLSRLFGVSRRSLHFWASGKPITQANEEHVQRVLAVVRSIDRGSADLNRSALLAPLDDGSIPFDLLGSRHYDDVLGRLGSGSGRAAPRPLSATAMAARAPQSPGVLAGAVEDRPHPGTGRLLATQPLPTRRRT